MPLDVTMTFAITYIIVYLIIAPMLVGAGIIPDWGPGVDGYKVANYNIYSQRETPAGAVVMSKGFVGLTAGGVIALAIVPLILHRTYLINSIKMAIKGEGQKGIMNPRILWAGWIVTGLILVALFTALTVPIWYSFIMLAFIGIFYLGIARGAATGGYYMLPNDKEEEMSAGYHALWGIEKLCGLGSFNTSAGAYNAALLRASLLGASQGTIMRCSPRSDLAVNLGMFKLAQLSKADRNKIAIGLIIGSIIPVLVVLPLSIYLVYTAPEPLDGTSSWLNEGYTNAIKGVTGSSPNHDANAWFYGSQVLGFVIVLLIMYARGIFPGPMRYISPVGFIMGSLGNAVYYWFVALISSILRIIIVRVAGPKVYEEKILPIAIGLLAGTGFQVILTAIICSLRGMGYVWWV